MLLQVAVYELGCAAGALSVIISGDRFGRRLTVMAGELIIIIGAILQASSFGLAQLIVGRIVGMELGHLLQCPNIEYTNLHLLQLVLVMVWRLPCYRLGTASALVPKTEAAL